MESAQFLVRTAMVLAKLKIYHIIVLKKPRYTMNDFYVINVTEVEKKDVSIAMARENLMMNKDSDFALNYTN